MNEFDDTLNDAVSDITDNGFSNSEQLEAWSHRIRAAALKNLPTPKEIHRRMKKAMDAFFKRRTDYRKAVKFHPGLSKFTLDRVKPHLRTELDRRIRMGVDLIKLNREQAIEKTLQRFKGWASSVPDGGSRVVDKRKVKKDIKKSVAQAKFEQRRVEIDQGHKLMSAVDSIIAEQNNAIAGMWRSHWRQPGYDYREDHKERDGKYYAVRNSWAINQGLINKGAGYTDEMTQAAEEPFCRCNMIWVNNLRDLPEDMLTAKGKEMLAQVRLKTG